MLGFYNKWQTQENELNLIILQLQIQKYPKMFNCSCKSKIILEVVNLCTMLFSVLYSYNRKKKHGQMLFSVCFMNMLLLDCEMHSWEVITVCVTWRFTGRWRKWTWKERHAQEKGILCMFWYFDFSGSSFMEWQEVVKYYISLNSFGSILHIDMLVCLLCPSLHSWPGETVGQ